MKPHIVKAIEMVLSENDLTGPNPGFQRQLLESRLKRLTEGVAEIREKAPHLVPETVKVEIQAIEDALQS